jgi:hypothetical protein
MLAQPVVQVEQAHPFGQLAALAQTGADVVVVRARIEGEHVDRHAAEPRERARPLQQGRRHPAV